MKKTREKKRTVAKKTMAEKTKAKKNNNNNKRKKNKKMVIVKVKMRTEKPVARYVIPMIRNDRKKKIDQGINKTTSIVMAQRGKKYRMQDTYQEINQ